MQVIYRRESKELYTKPAFNATSEKEGIQTSSISLRTAWAVFEKYQKDKVLRSLAFSSENNIKFKKVKCWNNEFDNMNFNMKKDVERIFKSSFAWKPSTLLEYQGWFRYYWSLDKTKSLLFSAKGSIILPITSLKVTV